MCQIVLTMWSLTLNSVYRMLLTVLVVVLSVGLLACVVGVKSSNVYLAILLCVSADLQFLQTRMEVYKLQDEDPEFGRNQMQQSPSLIDVNSSGNLISIIFLIFLCRNLVLTIVMFSFSISRTLKEADASAAWSWSQNHGIQPE